jgi:hypothetical protein
VHGHDVESAVELLRHPTSFHLWRWGADIGGRLVRVVGQGRVVPQHGREHLELPVRDVLERGRCSWSGRRTGSGTLGRDDGEHRGVRPADGAPDGGGEGGDGLSRGEHLRLAVVESEVVIAGGGGAAGPVVVTGAVRGPGGVGAVGVVARLLRRGWVGGALPLPPLGPRI